MNNSNNNNNSKAMIITFYIVLIGITFMIGIFAVSQTVSAFPIFFMPIFGIIGLVSTLNAFKRKENSQNKEHITIDYSKETPRQHQTSNSYKPNVTVNIKASGVILIVFGSFWTSTIVPIILTSSDMGSFIIMPIFFLLIGIVLIIAGIVTLIRGIKYSPKKERKSYDYNESNQNDSKTDEYFSEDRHNTKVENGDDYYKEKRHDTNNFYNEDDYFVKYCTSCGEQLKKSDKVCQACGKPVK